MHRSRVVEEGIAASSQFDDNLLYAYILVPNRGGAIEFKDILHQPSLLLALIKAHELKCAFHFPP